MLSAAQWFSRLNTIYNIVDPLFIICFVVFVWILNESELNYWKEQHFQESFQWY